MLSALFGIYIAEVIPPTKNVAMDASQSLCFCLK